MLYTLFLYLRRLFSCINKKNLSVYVAHAMVSVDCILPVGLASKNCRKNVKWWLEGPGIYVTGDNESANRPEDSNWVGRFLSSSMRYRIFTFKSDGDRPGLMNT